MENLIPLTAIIAIFVGMPWLILHYLTKWKQAKSITVEDEDLLDELHDIARRLDERMHTIERIIAADRGEAPRAPELNKDERLGDFRSPGQPTELRSRGLRKDY
ncbi:envelope stress response membrane protein PspB [Sandaracinobacter sp. RS1-74]|uniref:envelope stress response membrane protein PspB n=1 Tax=Sandaracinobacteroides sayramensis TaxID=2913411 RepID=UPI001EDB78C6|nr:envelope stress response membrane protein PspB [Sandaracinobacteroides sayramensis]MCG2840100.1 envelope stress response membrane protein PspB [Sandaracinobacteroides sayramensis]